MKPYELPQHIIDLANEYDESKHPRASDGKWTSGAGGAGASEETKGKLQKMLKHEAVSVAAGGNPATAGKDAVHFEYRGKQYYVGKDNEHMVKQFEDAGLVKRISGGAGAGERRERRMNQTSGDVNKLLSSGRIRWGDRNLAKNDLAHEFSAARAAVKSKGGSKILTEQEKENGRRGVRALHIAAIIQGFKYNRATHQYE